MSRHLVTSALPYINGIKHLGNLVGSLLPADVFARFLRSEGHEVLSVCATDEHGAPAELAAREAGQDVAEYCAEQHAIQADIYRRFRLSFDVFSRTSSPRNHQLTQEIFEQLSAQGMIEERELELVYSAADGRFLPDRYVVGSCPHCGYDGARGDQCEHCTRLLDPTELVEPRSAISGSTDLEVRSSRHLFLKLDRLEKDVASWVQGNEHWPLLTRSIAQKWLGEGLRERCITRDLSWGVPVPREGFEGKVFYVWFDAPIGYIGATADWADALGEADAWKSWWQSADEVVYTQFMGKDNLPFHTVMFPATLLGTGQPWKLADQIKGFHWMNYYGGKFSTSQKRGVFTDAALELFPPDLWRYFLMAHAPETSDYKFTWEQFVQSVNKDLAGVFGNFVNRVLRFCASKFDTRVPEGGSPGEREQELAQQCHELVAQYRKAMYALEFREAMRSTRALWAAGNQYITDSAPWTSIKTDPDAAAMSIRTCINLMALMARTSMPVMPDVSERILAALGVDGSLSLDEMLGLKGLPAGTPFELLPPAFERIPVERIAELEESFGGTE
jgi:methionyl-tRNA synthetase